MNKVMKTSLHTCWFRFFVLYWKPTFCIRLGCFSDLKTLYLNKSKPKEMSKSLNGFNINVHIAYVPFSTPWQLYRQNNVLNKHFHLKKHCVTKSLCCGKSFLCNWIYVNIWFVLCTTLDQTCCAVIYGSCLCQHQVSIWNFVIILHDEKMYF